MRIINRPLFGAAIGLLLVGGGLPGLASAQSFEFRIGTGDRPLVGRSFETMRALSHYLDQLAQHAAVEAQENAHHGSSDEAAAIDSIASFGEHVADFHERIDEYLVTPWDLGRDVQDLDRQARSVNNRLGRARLNQHVINDWYQVLDTLARMKRVLNGQDVDVPITRYPGRDYQRDYQSFFSDDRPGAQRFIEGSSLATLQTDLHNLDASVTRAHELAETAMNGRNDASRRLFERIHSFNTHTSELHRYSDMDRIDPRELGPAIQGLATEARSVNQALRQARAIPEVWEEWAEVLRGLDRLMSELRY